MRREQSCSGQVSVASLSLPIFAAVLAVMSLSAGAWAQSTSVNNAYTFLDNMMDTYASGSTLRLPPSYVNTPASNNGDVAYIYDDALMIIALLKRGTSDDIARAQIMGSAIVYAQTNDPIGDGRVRDQYHTDPFIKPNGKVNIDGGSDQGEGSDTGNMAWTGMALIQLYHATGNVGYLNAAESLGNFIQTNDYSTKGAGGYTGGINFNYKKITYKSTEHQIDLYGFFTMMATATGNTAWTADAQHALTELLALWNSTGGYYWIGTLNDGVTINKTEDPTPEDIQSWSYLATQLADHQQSMNWVFSTLSVTKGGFSGVAFDTGDFKNGVCCTGVWFEGTGHMAAALELRNLPGDAALAATYLSDIEYAQTNGLNNNGLGIIAASINGLEADFDHYYAALHVGATSWYCLAALGGNPFQFLQ
jgi:hypothetical protein